MFSVGICVLFVFVFFCPHPKEGSCFFGHLQNLTPPALPLLSITQTHYTLHIYITTYRHIHTTNYTIYYYYCYYHWANYDNYRYPDFE